jgi:hypothetical protein
VLRLLVLIDFQNVVIDHIHRSAFQVTVAAAVFPTPEPAGFPADQTAVSEQRPDVMANPIFMKLITVGLSAR